jgi:nitroreductase
MKTIQQPIPKTSVRFAEEFRKLLRQRRATRHFRADPVPEEAIDAALAMARQAPSGYNLQPWRFIIVRDPARRTRLRKAAMDQEKVTEAPLVIVCFAEHEAWKRNMDEIMAMRSDLTGWIPDDREQLKTTAIEFIQNLTLPVWLNRHAMIAFTYLMLAFEALGWDTAAMEGFDADKVKKVLSIPEKSEVIAMLAVGRARDENTRHPGRLDVGRLTFQETFDEPYVSEEESG